MLYINTQSLMITDFGYVWYIRTGRGRAVNQPGNAARNEVEDKAGR